METKLRMHNQKSCISALHGSLCKGDIKKWFCLCRVLRCEFALLVMFKAIYSPERLSSKRHPRYLTFACLISMSLYTIFKELTFRSLCLLPNIDFVFLFQSGYLIYSQQTSHTHLKNLLLVAFGFQFCFYVGKLYKYHSIK